MTWVNDPSGREMDPGSCLSGLTEEPTTSPSKPLTVGPGTPGVVRDKGNSSNNPCVEKRKSRDPLVD